MTKWTWGKSRSLSVLIKILEIHPEVTLNKRIFSRNKEFRLVLKASHSHQIFSTQSSYKSSITVCGLMNSSKQSFETFLLMYLR